MKLLCVGWSCSVVGYSHEDFRSLQNWLVTFYFFIFYFFNLTSSLPIILCFYKILCVQMHVCVCLHALLMLFPLAPIFIVCLLYSGFTFYFISRYLFVF